MAYFILCLIVLFCVAIIINENKIYYSNRKSFSQKIKIGIDLDNTLEDLVTPWLDYLNKKYNISYTLDDVNCYDMSKAIKELTSDQVYEPLEDESLFDFVFPLKDAVETLNLLNEDQRFEIYIVTNTKYSILKTKVKKVLFKYFSFISWKQVITINNKQLLNIDLLVDDNIKNLVNGKYDKILFDMPYNRQEDSCEIDFKNNRIFNSKKIKRANSWKQVYEYINKKYK